MPKPKATVDPSDVRHPSEALDLAMQGKRQSPSRDQLALIHTRYWDLKATMDRIANRGDGWVRIVPKPDDDRIYFKYKFTSGKFERSYVMAVVQLQQFPEGLMLLAHKLYQADEGLLKPTKDKLYEDE